MEGVCAFIRALVVGPAETTIRVPVFHDERPAMVNAGVLQTEREVWVGKHPIVCFVSSSVENPADKNDVANLEWGYVSWRYRCMQHG